MKKSITLYTAATVIALSSLSLNLAAADSKNDCDSTADGATYGAAIGGSFGIIAAFISGVTLCGPFAPFCVVTGAGLLGTATGLGAGGFIDSAICDK